MLPGVKFPSEEIVRAALTLVREQGGIRSVSAPSPKRSASWLSCCSSAPEASCRAFLRTAC